MKKVGSNYLGDHMDEIRFTQEYSPNWAHPQLPKQVWVFFFFFKTVNTFNLHCDPKPFGFTLYMDEHTH